jgi:hypothetical protein
MIVRRFIENAPRDKYGNTIILSHPRSRFLKTLRECAEGVDRASIAVDTQHKVVLVEPLQHRSDETDRIVVPACWVFAQSALFLGMGYAGKMWGASPPRRDWKPADLPTGFSMSRIRGDNSLALYESDPRRMAQG